MSAYCETHETASSKSWSFSCFILKTLLGGANQLWLWHAVSELPRAWGQRAPFLIPGVRAAWVGSARLWAVVDSYLSHLRPGSSWLRHAVPDPSKSTPAQPRGGAVCPSEQGGMGSEHAELTRWSGVVPELSAAAQRCSSPFADGRTRPRAAVWASEVHPCSRGTEQAQPWARAGLGCQSSSANSHTGARLSRKGLNTGTGTSRLLM